MKAHVIAASWLGVLLLALPPAGAQTASAPAASAAAASAQPAKAPAASAPVAGAASAGDPARSGMGQPATVVAADSDMARVNVVLRDIDAAPETPDLAAGLLASTLQPQLVTRPAITLLKTVPVPGTTRDHAAELRVQGLIPFGDSSVALLYRGRQVEQLRFSKPGLVVKQTSGGHVAREADVMPLTLVLQNPSGTAYRQVRARLRFDNLDVCRFGPAAAASGAAAGCESASAWTAFEMPRYTDFTLRMPAARAWFRDPASGLARNGAKTGLLTLRFEGETSGVVHEQNLPLEVRFVPADWAQTYSLAWVALLLFAGALVSLGLRVSVPNIKRRQALKDQLADAAKLTASISSEVDSTLRVLLRVLRLELDEIRVATFPIWPSYADYAVRVEQALPPLKRRIEAVRRLDTTTIRLRLLLEQNPAPTRVDQVEGYLGAVSETLKQDSLSDEDWVFVSQRLEAAQKLMREPTPADKEAFDAMLSGRWKAIKGHFGVTTEGALEVPPRLKAMVNSFPDKALLPAKTGDGDDDGAKWIQAVGAARADLQLSALSLLWEFHFLLPFGDAASQEPWLRAKHDLDILLATPVASNLREARSLLRQLAERVTESHITQALREGRASIEMDPAIPRPNQRIRFSVRFHDPHLNVAAARDLVACRWSFRDHHNSALESAGRNLRGWLRTWTATGAEESALEDRTLYEDGWSVHHYFERDVDHSCIRLEFHDAAGQLVVLPEATEGHPVWHCKPDQPVEASRRSQESWARFWLESVQMLAALLVPLATLALQSANDVSLINWWQLVAIGFASDTIKSILVGTPTPAPTK